MSDLPYIAAFAAWGALCFWLGGLWVREAAYRRWRKRRTRQHTPRHPRNVVPFRRPPAA